MPHKHKRKRGDVSNFDLPPSKVARPLAVGKTRATKDGKANPIEPGRRSKSNRSQPDTDTPKAFTRLMNFQRTGKHRDALDNGDPPPKKRKRSEGDKVAETDSRPTIKPGERLADFGARVDQALPIAGLNKKGKKQPGVPVGRRTKMEKKLQRLQAQLKQEESQRKEKEQEAREEQEDEDAEHDYWKLNTSRRKRRAQGEDDDDGDPWAVLKQSREKPRGLHDVVQAPPDFTRVPKEKFKVMNGAMADVADVPNAAGSLRRREELGGARRAIIESYRQLMDQKRNKDD